MSQSKFGTGTVLAVLVAMAVAGAGGYMLGDRSGQQKAELAAQPVATVNGEKITKATVYDRLAGQHGSQVVDQLINEALVNQAAKAAGVSVTSAEVQAEINKIRDRLGGEDKMKQAMAQYGITMEQLRQDQDNRLKLTKILSKDLKLDDATLKAFFDENIAMFDKREVNTRHILSASEEEAKAIKADLDKGTDFATLAKAKSIDPSAQQNGGDLGFHKPGDMDPQYDAVAFKTEKGKISEPFQTQFGWHVLQVVDIKGTAPVFENVKNEVREAALQEQVQEQIQPWLDQQKAQAKITNTFAPAQ